MTDQEITAACAVIAGDKVENCKECRGQGGVMHHTLRACTIFPGVEQDPSNPPKWKDCPTCTPIKELVEELEWKLVNPPNLSIAQRGTIPLIVHWMQVLGIWEEFVTWVNPISPVLSCTGGQENGYHLSSGEINKFADILINGKDRRNAITSFLEGRK